MIFLDFFFNFQYQHIKIITKIFKTSILTMIILKTHCTRPPCGLKKPSYSHYQTKTLHFKRIIVAYEH